MQAKSGSYLRFSAYRKVICMQAFLHQLFLLSSPDPVKTAQNLKSLKKYIQKSPNARFLDIWLRPFIVGADTSSEKYGQKTSLHLHLGSILDLQSSWFISSPSNREKNMKP